jgi:hypothetical protein
MPRTTRTIRTSRCRSVAWFPAIGMKSVTSPTPSALRNRVIKIGVPGRYSCRLQIANEAVILNRGVRVHGNLRAGSRWRRWDALRAPHVL